MEECYFRHVRSEISPLLPEKSSVVLEVGCGAGQTLHWLKKTGICSTAIGVEYDSCAATAAQEHADVVYVGDIEMFTPDIPENSVDLLLCLDVLEHLRDPWSTLRRLSAYVRTNGALIASIPNVRHKSVVFPLLFSSRWDYADAGHLDRGHLRFFVRESAIALLEQAGFAVNAVLGTGLGGSKLSRKVNTFIPEVIKGLLVKQFLLRGIKH